MRLRCCAEGPHKGPVLGRNVWANTLFPLCDEHMKQFVVTGKVTLLAPIRGVGWLIGTTE